MAPAVMLPRMDDDISSELVSQEVDMAVRKSSTWYQQASALVVFITVATGGLASFLGDVGGIRSAVTELFWPKPEAKVPTAEISVREVSRSALRTTRDQRAGREGTRYRI